MVEIIIKEVIRFRKYERFHDSGGFPDKGRRRRRSLFFSRLGRYISFIFPSLNSLSLCTNKAVCSAT